MVKHLGPGSGPRTDGTQIKRNQQQFLESPTSVSGSPNDREIPQALFKLTNQLASRFCTRAFCPPSPSPIKRVKTPHSARQSSDRLSRPGTRVPNKAFCCLHPNRGLADPWEGLLRVIDYPARGSFRSWCFIPVIEN